MYIFTRLQCLRFLQYNQFFTGPDIDWIVAGSGSVSPGTGRTRGQIIATSRSAQGRASR